jgi:NAD(P)-dependent dehydrogenase (short-subunit alcohol dehydrogenase family)
MLAAPKPLQPRSWNSRAASDGARRRGFGGVLLATNRLNALPPTRRQPFHGSDEMSKHQGKVAVITGGTSGIGFAAAERLAAEGAYVFVTGRRAPELDAAVKHLGENVSGVQGDVSKLADLDRLFAVVRREKGHIDILYASAGVGQKAPLGSITEEHFDREFGINVKGVFFTVQKALPLLRDGGSIILNASIVASRGFPALSVYSVTKAALRSFARTWTTDLKDRKIRVNVVSPGPIDTPGLQGLDNARSEQLTEAYAAHIPLGRTGRPDDIAKAVSFLAADESSFISGTELFVDGGLAQV